MQVTRRSFVLGGTAVLTALGRATPLLASVLEDAQSRAALPDQRLEEGWEFYKGPLDPRFQIWYSQELVTWEPMTVPHCFNAYDGCDPDVPAYRGPGWYRRKLKVANPYTNGRTLLHFEGAGQRAEVYVGNTLVASHSGGYDEFNVDITEPCRALKPGDELALAVLCDNGRDIERMPSDLSDFTLYGGLYRHVHLVYLPQISFEAVHAHVDFEPGRGATIVITARLHAPEANAKDVELQIGVEDPQGHSVFQSTLKRAIWTGEAAVAKFEIASPMLWSPSTPNLYRCTVSATAAGDAASVSHRFGVRHAQFETHGPFLLNGQRLLIRGTHRHEDHAGYAAAMP
ncbi:MAG TPA: glycoside hydrolase family 2, partial [Acidobacteriaceae bacterium]